MFNRLRPASFSRHFYGVTIFFVLIIFLAGWIPFFFFFKSFTSSHSEPGWAEPQQQAGHTEESTSRYWGLGLRRAEMTTTMKWNHSLSPQIWSTTTQCTPGTLRLPASSEDPPRMKLRESFPFPSLWRTSTCVGCSWIFGSGHGGGSDYETIWVSLVTPQLGWSRLKEDFTGAVSTMALMTRFPSTFTLEMLLFGQRKLAEIAWQGFSMWGTHRNPDKILYMGIICHFFNDSLCLQQDLLVSCVSVLSLWCSQDLKSGRIWKMWFWVSDLWSRPFDFNVKPSLRWSFMNCVLHAKCLNDFIWFSFFWWISVL